MGVCVIGWRGIVPVFVAPAYEGPAVWVGAVVVALVAVGAGAEGVELTGLFFCVLAASFFLRQSKETATWPRPQFRHLRSVAVQALYV